MKPKPIRPHIFASVMIETHMAAVIALWPIWFWAMGEVALTIIVPAAFAKMNMTSITQNTGVLTIWGML